MSAVAYRGTEIGLRAEVDGLLRAVSPLRRTILSPALLHELDALTERVARETDIRALDEAVVALRAVAARAEEEIIQVRGRSRAVPRPPEPLRSVRHYHHVCIEAALYRQLRHATRWEPWGPSVLAHIEEDDVPMVAAARGRGRLPFELVDGCARAAAPHGPSLVIEPQRRSFFGFGDGSMKGSDAPFDEEYSVGGQRAVASAVLDASTCAQLLSMRGCFYRLVVGGGVVEIAWSLWSFAGMLPATVVPPAAPRIIASIARRLYAA